MNTIVNIILWIAYVLSLYFSIFLLLVYFDHRKAFCQNREITPKLNCFPLVSVLVPAYNEESTITKTLESLSNLDYPKSKLEVIVINDGSKDNTKSVIEKYIRDKPQFKLLSHSNCGKGASLNLALKQTQGEFFACLDADSFVDKATLKKMLAIYERENNPKLAIVTPAMKVYHPKNLLQRLQWLEYIVIIFISRLTSQLDSLYVAPGPFSLYRTSVIKKIGGFDEKNITEDQEIAYRVQQHQYQIKQCPEGYVFTTAPKELKPFYNQRRRWYVGGITCLHQYRKLVANKKYGDFGMMQMVKNVLGFMLVVTGMVLVIYLFMLPAFRTIRDLILIKFNLLPYILNLKLKLDFMSVLLSDFRIGFLMLSLMLIGLFFFYRAHRNAREKMLKTGWIPLIPYAFFYYTVKGIILLTSLAEFSYGKKMKWK